MGPTDDDVAIEMEGGMAVDPTDVGEGGVEVAFWCEVDGDVAYEVAGDVASGVDDEVDDDVAIGCIGGQGGVGDWSSIAKW